ncbi:protein UNUSUAL FLORAL ORGANS [Phalaenopsis equestris]|uniref:protein UNUSUAL FLORAL ORGANS n=1 Tax=Phalaenopsis equestris TaxID=78828 RepID=UPI0009E28CD0|nr:protein UNUSUAL FLORAL ORGANS [Phalaenopsis equestris]
MKSMKPSSSSVAVEMDSRIWRNLPPGLVDRILALLPPPEFFRFRAVCKRWYSLLFSDSFLEANLRLAPRRPWFAFFLLPSSTKPSSSTNPPPPALLLDPTTKLWLRLPLCSFLPPGFSPAASDSGILCFISDSPGPKTILLSNPLSKLVAHLPPTPHPRLYPSVGLTAGPSSLSLILAGDDLISPYAVKNLTAECFHADGATGFYSPWSTVSQLPRLCSPDPARLVFSQNTFYCMSSAPFAILSYDVAANNWSKIQAPMRRFLRSPSLALRGGSPQSVLIIAAVEKNKLSVPRSVRVWSLQPCSKAWTETERMPPEIYSQFSEAEGGRGFECVSHGDILAITIKGSTEIILFDFITKEWRWAPPCPFTGGESGGREFRGFAYEPRLATPAVGLIDSSSLSFQ